MGHPPIKDYDLEAFAIRVIETRESLGFNKSELARHADMSPSNIGKIETGSHYPYGTTMRRLAGALKVSVNWLKYGQDVAPVRPSAPKRKEVEIAKVDGIEKSAARVISTPPRANNDYSGNLKVKMLETIATVNFKYETGLTYYIPTATAIEFIRYDIALLANS